MQERKLVKFHVNKKGLPYRGMDIIMGTLMVLGMVTGFLFTYAFIFGRYDKETRQDFVYWAAGAQIGTVLIELFRRSLLTYLEEDPDTLNAPREWLWPLPTVGKFLNKAWLVFLAAVIKPSFIFALPLIYTAMNPEGKSFTNFKEFTWQDQLTIGMMVCLYLPIAIVGVVCELIPYQRSPETHAIVKQDSQPVEAKSLIRGINITHKINGVVNACARTMGGGTAVAFSSAFIYNGYDMRTSDYFVPVASGIVAGLTGVALLRALLKTFYRPSVSASLQKSSEALYALPRNAFNFVMEYLPGLIDFTVLDPAALMAIPLIIGATDPDGKTFNEADQSDWHRYLVWGLTAMWVVFGIASFFLRLRPARQNLVAHTYKKEAASSQAPRRFDRVMYPREGSITIYQGKKGTLYSKTEGEMDQRTDVGKVYVDGHPYLPVSLVGGVQV